MIQPDEGYVEANGIRLHTLLWRSGQASLPPLLLLHATGFLARLWQPVAELLSPRFDVYAFDTRGHGDSDKPPPEGENYHWRNLVEDLGGFCDTLGFRGVSMAGHSSGGAAVAYLATERPEYISKLVLFEPIILPPQFVPPSDRRSELAEGARKRRAVWPNTQELVEAYRTRPVFERWRDDVLRLYAEHGAFRREDGQIELKCSGEIEAQVFEHSSSLDTWDRLPEIRSPALVMHGELTGEQFLALMSQIAQRIPRGRLASVPGAGHLAPMERPEAVAQSVLEFIEEPE